MSVFLCSRTVAHSQRSVEPLVTYVYLQGSIYLESACHPRARCIRSQHSHLPTLPPNHRLHFSGGQQTCVRAAAHLAWVIAINAARNQDRSGKGLAMKGLANLRAVLKKGWAKSTRIQPPREELDTGERLNHKKNFDAFFDHACVFLFLSMHLTAAL